MQAQIWALLRFLFVPQKQPAANGYLVSIVCMYVGCWFPLSGNGKYKLTVVPRKTVWVDYGL
jgi:hypothetical protein